MPFEYLDHTADAAIRARGASLAEALSEAARALFAIMVPLEQVELRETVGIRAAARTPELLVVEWLAELLAQRDLTGMLFADFDIVCARSGGERWTLEGTVRGEPIDRRRHEVGPEVKGVSYSGLRVDEAGGIWTVQCVVDL